MQDLDICCKTEAGLAELRDRALRLPPRLRTMLIMVDGIRTVAQLRMAALSLGAPEDCLQVLLSMGLVGLDSTRQRPDAAAVPRAPSASAEAAPPQRAPRPDDNERLRATVKFLNDSVVDLLGLRAFLWTLRLEKCFSVNDVLALLPEFSKAIAKHKGAEMARALEAQVRQMLQ
jgi:hypothetical protein